MFVVLMSRTPQWWIYKLVVNNSGYFPYQNIIYLCNNDILFNYTKRNNLMNVIGSKYSFFVVRFRMRKNEEDTRRTKLKWRWRQTAREAEAEADAKKNKSGLSLKRYDEEMPGHYPAIS